MTLHLTRQQGTRTERELQKESKGPMWQEDGVLWGVGVQKLSSGEGWSSQDWSHRQQESMTAGTKPRRRTAKSSFSHQLHQKWTLVRQVKDTELWTWLKFLLAPLPHCAVSFISHPRMTHRILFYFTILLEWPNPIKKIVKSFMSNQMPVWLTHSQAF